MSRERISNYKVTVASGNVTVHIVKPSGITLATELTVEDENIGTYYLIYDSQESKWYVDGASPVVYYTTDDISTVHVGSNVYREVEGEPVGAGVVTAIGYTADSQRIVTEAVRLILDETALVVFCSSMKKANISSIAPSAETNYDIAITFVIPTSKIITATDAFTVEFDWALPMDFSALAKQGTNPNATNTQILYDVNHLVIPPPTGMAMESTLTAGITALQNAITALYGGDLTATLSALKTAIGNIDIDIDTTDLAKADKLQDAQDDIDALQVLVGSTTDVSTDSTIFGKLAAVISAISALSIPTVAQIQNGLAKTSELPTGYALETSVKDGNDTTIGLLKDQTNGLAAIKSSAASAATDAAAIETLIGTSAAGQPSTLFAAIAAGGGGGGDATAANQQIIIGAVKDGNDTTIDIVKDIDTYGAKDATVAKEAAATANKNQVISAIGDTLSVNMLATGLSAMAGVPMNNITDDGTTTAYTLNANELYYFNNRSSDLELTLNLGMVSQGDAADFHLIVQVAAGASPLTVTIKDSDNNDVVWSDSYIPDFSAGIIYEIGIINNLALYVSYDI